MTQKNSEKTTAREMQKAAGWPYTKCLRKVREIRLAEEHAREVGYPEGALIFIDPPEKKR